MSDAMRIAQNRYDAMEAEPAMTDRDRARLDAKLDDLKTERDDLREELRDVSRQIVELEEELED